MVKKYRALYQQFSEPFDGRTSTYARVKMVVRVFHANGSMSSKLPHAEWNRARLEDYNFQSMP